MKIKVLSVLKTSETEFDCFEDSSVVYACGSTLCIKELGSTQCEFIGLGPKMTKLFAFKTAVDFKSILTAEMTIDGLRVSNYGLDKDRTVINISDGEDGLSGECIESVELLTDSNDASLVYGSIRCKNDTSCVFVVDFAKKKVGAIGFLPHFPDIKVNQTGKANLTVCGNTVSANANANPNGSNPSTSNPSGNINESNSVVFVKHFRASNGYW